MEFKAEINIMPLEKLLDPQGKAVTKSMKNIGLSQIENVRVGRHIQMIVNADDEKKAHQYVEEACKKLLANQIMEDYSIQLQKI